MTEVDTGVALFVKFQIKLVLEPVVDQFGENHYCKMAFVSSPV